MFNNFYKDKRIFLTGHTGFKGSWLCEWLLSLGAEVHGYARDPQAHETLFDQLGLSQRLAIDQRADLADLCALSAAIAIHKPDVIFHLAAQPIVRLSYEQPIETFATNVIGTANLLEAIRTSGHPCTVICITTDKCYENREWLYSYREQDAMGGYDPYSASKGAAELVIASYRRSYFGDAKTVRLASVRAGNVIGGGDWAPDRIIPDCFRASKNGIPIPVRNKIATRPWQHVLEPLSGYLWLAAKLASADDDSAVTLASPFNFGPTLQSNQTVARLVEELCKHTGAEWHDASDPHALHEASKLNLAIDKAFHLLEWQPVWEFEETVRATVEWYLNAPQADSIAGLTRQQIQGYINDATVRNVKWAQISI